MELIYCWLTFIVIDHIILYIYWIKHSSEGNTIGSMYNYYIEDSILCLLFILIVWTPLNIIIPLATVIIIISELLKNIQIR